MNSENDKDKKRLLRLEESSLRLETIHQMRWKLMETLSDNENQNIYYEANELLNEIEHKLWDYINGKVDLY